MGVGTAETKAWFRIRVKYSVTCIDVILLFNYFYHVWIFVSRMFVAVSSSSPVPVSSTAARMEHTASTDNLTQLEFEDSPGLRPRARLSSTRKLMIALVVVVVLAIICGVTSGVLVSKSQSSTNSPSTPRSSVPVKLLPFTGPPNLQWDVSPDNVTVQYGLALATFQDHPDGTVIPTSKLGSQCTSCTVYNVVSISSLLGKLSDAYASVSSGCMCLRNSPNFASDKSTAVDTLFVPNNVELVISTDWHLRVACWNIEGRVYLGTANAPYSGTAEIVLDATLSSGANHCTGYDLPVILVSTAGSLYAYGDKGIGGSWFTLTSPVQPGDTEIRVSENILDYKWQVGDQIVLSSTEPAIRRNISNEVATISTITTALDGTSFITVSSPLLYHHSGTTFSRIDPYTSNAPNFERGEIGLLSRNIKIRAADASGGHIRASNGLYTMHLSGVELIGLGMLNTGDYPVHFHRTYNMPADGVVQFNSIHQSLHHCVTLHETHGIHVVGNVAFDNFGHCMFTEDGMETENRFIKNLVIGTKGYPRSVFATKLQFPLGTTDSAASFPLLSETVMLVSSFWLANPDNTYISNVAAGSDGIGYWLSVCQNVRQSTFDIFALSPNRYPSYDNRFIPLGPFRNNIVHSLRQAAVKLTWDNAVVDACGNPADTRFYARMDTPMVPTTIDSMVIFQNPSEIFDVNFVSSTFITNSLFSNTGPVFRGGMIIPLAYSTVCYGCVVVSCPLVGFPDELGGTHAFKSSLIYGATQTPLIKYYDPAGTPNSLYYQSTVKLSIMDTLFDGAKAYDKLMIVPTLNTPVTSVIVDFLDTGSLTKSSAVPSMPYLNLSDCSALSSTLTWVLCSSTIMHDFAMLAMVPFSSASNVIVTSDVSSKSFSLQNINGLNPLAPLAILMRTNADKPANYTLNIGQSSALQFTPYFLIDTTSFSLNFKSTRYNSSNSGLLNVSPSQLASAVQVALIDPQTVQVNMTTVGSYPSYQNMNKNLWGPLEGAYVVSYDNPQNAGVSPTKSTTPWTTELKSCCDAAITGQLCVQNLNDLTQCRIFPARHGPGNV